MVDIGDMFRRAGKTPLAELLACRERIRVQQNPDLCAADLARWAQLAIESLSDSPAARAASHEDHQRLIRQMLSQRSEDRAQLRIARAELSFLGSQLKRVQALLVVDGNADEAAAALHDLLTTPGDASLLLAGKAVDRTGGEDDCA